MGEGEGKVGDDQSVRFGANYSSRVVNHHFKRDAYGVLHAEDGVSKGVSHENEVSPALVGDTSRDGIVGGEADDRTFAFKCADGPGGSLHVFGIIG